MALSDWLNPATPQPSFLTSRAAGVVVPEFYRAATEARKSSLALAGQEQSLRFNEEQNQRAREAEERRKAEEAAAASLMPGLTRLDPRSPTYFQDLTRQLSTPGAANALASQSVRSFLDIAGGARSEQLRMDEEERAESMRRAEEGRLVERQVASEERADARGSLEGVERLAQKYAEDLEDDDFLTAYTGKLNEIRALQKTKPTEVPSRLTSLTEELTRDRNQRSIKKELLNYGLPLEKIEKLREKSGKFGDTARSQLGVLRNRAESRRFLNDKLEALNDSIKLAETDPAERRRLQEQKKKLLEGFDVSDVLGGTDAGAKYFTPQTGGAPAATKGESKI